jgi:multiple sugar transport system permease protein
MSSSTVDTTSVSAGAPAAGLPRGRARRRFSGRPGRGGRPRGHAPLHVALLWLGPALLLIAGVVIYPVVELVKASMGRYSITGLRLGDAGARNYSALAGHPALGTVLRNTAIWVVAVVALTIVISLALAQFLAKDFAGRRAVRWAVIVPWAASLVITARLFTLVYDYYHGILNRLLSWLHIIGQPVDWLGDDRFTMPSMIAVGVFVSIPFTAYVFLAGLNSIPADVHEAATVDGASKWQAYRHVTLPMLRPALLVATVLNIIYVFNSFPLIYTLNDRNPGFTHDTSITFMYKLAFKSAERDVGMSAAAGVGNVVLILIAVLVYLRTVRWSEEAR